MAHTIDLTKIEGAQLSSEGNASDLAYLKANGPRALPDSPTANGWSADAIKKQFYKQSEILFAWLKRLAESQLDLGEKINDYLDDLGSGGEFPLVFDTLANAQAAVSAGEVKAGAIVFVSNGSDIKAYYCGDEGLVSVGGDLVHKSGAETITGKKTFSGGASFTAGNVNFGSSGSDNGKTLDVYYTINLRGPVTSNTIIPGNTFALGSAEHYWGSAYIDELFLYGVISDGMYEWAFPSKNGTIVLDSDITKSALETILGAASSSSNGYMSSSDKSHLDALYALLGSEADADSVVDTINEVLSVFNQYPEGVELSLVLAGKVGYSDIVDVLNSTATNKALSANQGKALNDRLTTAEGTISNHGTRLTTAEADKADKTGYYGTMGAGFADTAKSLQTSVGRADETPFGFQTTGGSADVETGIQQFRKLVGVSVVRNQQIANGDFSNGTTGWRSGSGSYSLSASSNKLTATVLEANTSGDVRTTKRIAPIKGHKYLLTVTATCSETTDMRVAVDNSGFYLQNTPISLTANTRKTYFLIIDYNGNSELSYIIFYGKMTDGGLQVGTTLVLENVYLYDLTQRYGNNTVVNAIIGNDSTKYVANLLRFDPSILKQTAYDAGTLVSSQSAKLKSVGRNAFDGELEGGGINNSDGQNNTNSANFRTKNYTRVAGGNKYVFEYNRTDLGGYMYVSQYDINKNWIKTNSYIENGAYQLTLESNCCYVKANWYKSGSGWDTNVPTNANICIYPYWDGSQTGFIDYESQTYDLPNIVQRGILKVDGDGNVYADGDVAYPDGTGETRYGSYTFTGNETFTSYGGGYAWEGAQATIGAKVGTTNYICTNLTKGENAPEAQTKPVIFFHANGNIYLGKSASDMTGAVLYYELATPTEIESDPFPENVWADDFGTTQFLDSDGNEIVGLQGADFFYQANIAGFAESVYVKTDGDPEKIVYEDEVYAKAQADARFALKEALGGTLRQVLAMKATLDFNNTNYIDMGDYEWAMFTTGGGYSYFRIVVSDLKTEADDTKMRNMLSTKYAASSWYDVYQNGKDKVVSSIGTYIIIRDTSYSDADSFNAAMKGSLIAYEKAS